MQLLTFDIFAGVFEQNPMWLEAVQGLDHAKTRMEQIASQKPGNYFVFCSATHAVVASLESGKKLDPAPKPATPPSNSSALRSTVCRSSARIPNLHIP